jgi:putative zinc finger/helix-turn-helix YgiT family protein
MEVQEMKCVECGAQMRVERRNYRDKMCGLPGVTLLGIEMRYCPKCGEEEVLIPRLQGLHKALAQAVVRKAGRLSAAEVRFLRKHLGWSGSDFAKRIGVSPETVSRWENGREAIGPQADRLLRLMVVYLAPVESYKIEELETVGSGKITKLNMKLREGKAGWALAAAG